MVDVGVGGVYVEFSVVGLGVVVVCVCSTASSFIEAEIDRSSSVILFMVINSSSTLADNWLSFSLSLLMVLPQALKVTYHLLIICNSVVC